MWAEKEELQAKYNNIGLLNQMYDFLKPQEKCKCILYAHKEQTYLFTKNIALYVFILYVRCKQNSILVNTCKHETS